MELSSIALAQNPSHQASARALDPANERITHARASHLRISNVNAIQILSMPQKFRQAPQSELLDFVADAYLQIPSKRHDSAFAQAVQAHLQQRIPSYGQMGGMLVLHSQA
jgi:hypothetical protein